MRNRKFNNNVLLNDYLSKKIIPETIQTKRIAGFFDLSNLIVSLLDPHPLVLIHEVIHWLQTTLTNEGYVTHWLYNYLYKRKLLYAKSRINNLRVGQKKILQYISRKDEFSCSEIQCSSQDHALNYIERFLTIHLGYHDFCDNLPDIYDGEVFIHQYKFKPFPDLCEYFNKTQWQVPLIFYCYNNDIRYCVAGVHLLYEGMAKAVEFFIRSSEDGPEKANKFFDQQYSDLDYCNYFLLYKYFHLNLNGTHHFNIKTFIALCDIALTASVTLAFLVSQESPIISEYMNPVETFAIIVSFLKLRENEFQPLIWNRDYPRFCNDILNFLSEVSEEGFINPEILVERRREAHLACFSKKSFIGPLSLTNSFAKIGEYMISWAEKWEINYIGEIFFNKPKGFEDILSKLFGNRGEAPIIAYVNQDQYDNRSKNNMWMFSMALQNDFLDFLLSWKPNEDYYCLSHSSRFPLFSERCKKCHKKVNLIIERGEKDCPYFNIALEYNDWPIGKYN